MNKVPSIELINDLAIEMVVDPLFIEKDWYAVQLIKLISKFGNNDILPVFSGGTSLSKGYGLIKRFSEDVDFKIKTENLTRGQRKHFREGIIALVSSSNYFNILESSIESRNESKFFSFNIEYPGVFSLHQSLRPNLKLEMSFNNPQLGTEKRQVASFVSSSLNNEADAEIECVSPIETAADKFSALVWRIEIRDRKAVKSTTKNDPTMIRHLYDLCMLKDLVNQSVEFIELVKNTLKQDQGRGGSNKESLVKEKIEYSVHQLQYDKDYAIEYSKFVDAVFYGADSERIEFNTAVDNYKQIADLALVPLNKA